ncbi:HNH endonuclease [Silvimonas soli]|uniref:HNH endonuclease n=1 Tax=Silvimonas soli TaxID=2980100 RepID=UPI0024B3B48A|nr:HNH endonuclease signature motif containing protein [Silvimonas soli]
MPAQTYDAQRGSSAKRGYGTAWRKARAAWLRKHPLCVECEQQGVLIAATVVDHIKPHKGDMALFWDRDNWQSLCKSHHDRKTATEDGGFGHGPATEQQGTELVLRPGLTIMRVR